MENFIYYASVPLYIAYFYVYMRVMSYMSSKENFHGRKGGDIMLSSFFILIFVGAIILPQFVACRSDGKLSSVYEGALFYKGLFFTVSGLLMLASFFVSEKIFILDTLKYALSNIDKRIVLFFSMLSFLWGFFVMCAPLAFDFSVQSPRCYF